MSTSDFGFLTTHWSVVRRAGREDDDGARAALEDLCAAYWWPLYAYARRRGASAEDAADSVQGFFAELLEKGAIGRAVPERGRFRAFLLGALQHHLSHERERAGALKRGGGAAAIPLDPVDADRRWQLVSASECDPELTFERAGVLALLERALARVAAEYARDGRRELFEALKGTIGAEGDAEPLRAIGARLEMTEGAIKVSAHRLREAWRKAVRAEVASTVDDLRDVDDEIRRLLEVLGRP